MSNATVTIRDSIAQFVVAAAFGAIGSAIVISSSPASVANRGYYSAIANAYGSEYVMADNMPAGECIAWLAENRPKWGTAVFLECAKQPNGEV